MSIFEGLIKPTIDTTVNTDTDIDMSEKTQNTYNTYNTTINVDKLVIADERLALQLIGMLGSTAAPKPEQLPDHTPTPS